VERSDQTRRADTGTANSIIRRVSFTEVNETNIDEYHMRKTGRYHRMNAHNSPHTNSLYVTVAGNEDVRWVLNDEQSERTTLIDEGGINGHQSIEYIQWMVDQRVLGSGDKRLRFEILARGTIGMREGNRRGTKGLSPPL